MNVNYQPQVKYIKKQPQVLYYTQPSSAYPKKYIVLKDNNKNYPQPRGKINKRQDYGGDDEYESYGDHQVPAESKHHEQHHQESHEEGHGGEHHEHHHEDGGKKGDKV